MFLSMALIASQVMRLIPADPWQVVILSGRKKNTAGERCCSQNHISETDGSAKPKQSRFRGPF